MTKRSKLLHCTSATLLVAFVLLCGFSGLAQSGRRPKAPAALPAATPEPTPTSTPTKPTDEKTLTLIVGVDRYSDVSDIPLSFYSSVLSTCVERLDDAKSLNVKPTSENMSRSDAVKRAKDEKEGYVVSLQLRSTSTRMGGQMTRDLNDVYLEYAVFAATSGKVVASGRTYQGDKPLGGVITRQPTGRNTIGDYDYWLQQAARAAAERILASLKVHVTRLS